MGNVSEKRQAVMSAYAIKPNYTARLEPAYFQDTQPDGLTWQPDVYSIAAYLARLMKRHTLIDIGCGRAHKLIEYAGEFALLGVDYGENIQWCKDHYPEYGWIEANLEASKLMITHNMLENAVIICADVIEHLSSPNAILSSLAEASYYAPILLTTPDRLRLYGYDHDGMPSNPHHVREWTLEEMTTLLNSRAIPITWAGYTASENRTRIKNTMLLMLGLDAAYAQAVEQAFDVEAARPQGESPVSIDTDFEGDTSYSLPDDSENV